MMAEYSRITVCGMMVDRDTTIANTVPDGAICYFRCAGCRHTFEKNPGSYGFLLKGFQ